jgi:hypothetical protein
MDVREVRAVLDESTGCLVCVSHAQVKGRRSGELWHPMKWIGEKKTHVSMHRWVWENKNGPLPRGVVLRHTCDNPRCITINHLVPGLQSDNVRDREERGRTAYGERAGCVKLKREDVLQIFSRRGVTSRRALAKEFGVSISAIVDIQLGRTWARTTLGLPRCPKRKGRT